MNNRLKHCKNSIQKIITSFKGAKSIARNYVLVLLGILLLFGYFYSRFLRSRLPRDIPFNLTLFGLTIIAFICGIYLYIVIRLIKAKNISKSPIVIQISEYLAQPLIALDFAIKKNKYIKPYYDKLILKLLVYILPINSGERVLIVLTLNIFPNIILLAIFLVDVFVLKKIEIFYYFLLLGLLPLMHIYYNYFLIIIREGYMNQLCEKYDEVIISDKKSEYNPIGFPFDGPNPKAIYHNKRVTLKEYFNIQLQERYKDPEDNEIEYYGYPFAKEEILKPYHRKNNRFDTPLTSQEYAEIKQLFFNTEEALLDLMEYIDLSQYIYNLYNIKKIRIIIYSLYFIAWSYILIKSFHTLPPETLDIFRPKDENPFS